MLSILNVLQIEPVFMFSAALAPLLVYLITAGVKSVFGGISGYASMAVAAFVASLLLFGEALIGGLGPEIGAIVTSIVELLLLIAAGFGLNDLVKENIGRRA